MLVDGHHRTSVIHQQNHLPTAELLACSPHLFVRYLVTDWTESHRSEGPDISRFLDDDRRLVLASFVEIVDQAGAVHAEGRQVLAMPHSAVLRRAHERQRLPTPEPAFEIDRDDNPLVRQGIITLRNRIGQSSARGGPGQSRGGPYHSESSATLGS